MKNILHISDLHASSQVLRMDEYKIKNMMSALLDDANNVEKIDTVFITGDLTFSAKSNEYDLVKNHVIQPIIEKLGIDKKNIFIVPGNHDIQRDMWAKSDKSLKKGLFSPYDENEINEIFQEKNDSETFNWFNNYNDLKKWLNEGKDIIVTSNLYDVFQINDIGIACLNSSWLANGEDKNKLAVTKNQISTAIQHMKKCKQKIILMHHPLDWLHEDDRVKISEYIHTSGINFYLYGHMHEHHVIQESHFNNNNIIKVQAGKIDISSQDDYAGYSIISLHQTNTLQSGKIYFRKYNNTTNDFGKWNKRVPEGEMSFSLSDKCIFNIEKFSEISKKLIEHIDYDLLCNTGLEQEKKKKLTEIFIEPHLTENAKLNADVSTEKENSISFSNLINSEKSFCIFGNENTGKTTLARKITLEYLTRQKFKNIDNVVYYLNCEELSNQTITEIKLINKIASFYEAPSKNYSEFKEFNRKIQDDVFSNKSVIILDSIDRCDNIKQIFNLIKDKTNARFLIFARSNIKRIIDALIDECNLTEKFSSIVFSGLGRTDIRNLIERWLPENQHENKSIITKQAFDSVNKAGMPNNHFIYSMIMSIYERKSHNIKTYLHEADLLENFIEILLHKHCLTDGNKPQYKDFILFLGYLANNLAIEKSTCISQNRLYALIIKFNQLIGQDFDIEGYIQPILKSGIIISINGNYCFSQACFFNYCFAHYLSKHTDTFYETDKTIDYLYFDKSIEYLSAIKKNDINLINFVGNKTHDYLAQTAQIENINLSEIDVISLLKDLVDGTMFEHITEENIESGYEQRNKTEEESDAILDKVSPVNEYGSDLKIKDDDNITPNVLLQRTLSLYARTYRAAEHIMSQEENNRIINDIYKCYMNNLSLTLHLFKTKFKDILVEKIKQKIGENSVEIDHKQIDAFIRFTASFFPMWITDLMSNDLFNQRQIIKMKQLRDSLNENFDKIIITFSLCNLDDVNILSEIKSMKYTENFEIALLLFKFIELSNFNFTLKDREKEQLKDYIGKIIGKRRSFINDYTNVSNISANILEHEKA